MTPRNEDSVPTRLSLLLRLKQLDDATAWREFFETYWTLIYNVSRKAGLTDSEAQDVVQETVIGVARKIAGFEADSRRGSFKSWLLGQARWRIGDRFRARKRDGTLFAEGPNPPSADDSTVSDLAQRFADPAGDVFEKVWDEEWKEHVTRTALEQVKARVSVRQFQMFDLNVRQGLSVAETAKAMGSSAAAVYMAKSRVGRLMKRELRALKACGG